MSKVAMATGILLVIVGLAGYFTPQSIVTDGPDGETIEAVRGSWTALIPAIAGLPIFVFGLWATVQPSSKKTAMHVAVTIGLLGALAATGRGIVSLLKFINADGDFNQRAFVFISIMGLLCWMFVIFCVMSFIKAQKAQDARESSA